jgi:hypothetical protein
VDIGSTWVFGAREGGISVDRATVTTRGGTIDLNLDLTVGIGQVDVERAPA